jgi:hypothetical protein
MRAGAVALGAAALLAVSAAAPAWGAQVLGREAFPTQVTAFHGHVVWSSYVGHGRRYALKEWFRGRTRTLPVARRLIPFDVDLGPGPHGAVTAVYSRCRSDGGGNLIGSEGQFGSYPDTAGCDLYRYRLSASAEQRLHVRGEKAASEYLPSIWGRRIAFARVWEHRKGRQGVYPYLYSSSVTGREAPRRLPGGTRGPYPNSSIDSHPTYEGGPGPIGLDLRGSRLAFAWNAQVTRCRSEDDGDFPLLLSEMWLLDIGRTAPRRVDHGCAGDPTLWVATPSLGPERLFYYQQRNAAPEAHASHLRSYRPGTGKLSDNELPARTLAIARDGKATYYVRSAGGGYRVVIERR